MCLPPNTPNVTTAMGTKHASLWGVCTFVVSCIQRRLQQYLPPLLPTLSVMVLRCLFKNKYACLTKFALVTLHSYPQHNFCHYSIICSVWNASWCDVVGLFWGSRWNGGNTTVMLLKWKKYYCNTTEKEYTVAQSFCSSRLWAVTITVNILSQPWAR